MKKELANDLANNKTQIFCAILDLMSKYVMPVTIEKSQKIDLGDNIRNIVKFSVELTGEVMVDMLLSNKIYNPSFNPQHTKIKVQPDNSCEYWEEK